MRRLRDSCSPKTAVRRVALPSVFLVVVVLVATALGGCRATPSVSLPAGPVPGAVGNQILLEPEHGLEPVYALLRSARTSVDMTMYELIDDNVTAILAADAARGVRVRVVLDQRIERSRNQPAYDFLRAHGVRVAWANSRYAVTHQKTAVIDCAVAAILSLNLVSKYYPNTRDVGVLTTDAPDVDAIESVFEADFAGRSIHAPPGDDLLWSPGAEDALVALVDNARSSVAVETEVLSDKPMLDALVRAARRGVRTTLVMTYQQDWATPFTTLAKAGVEVRYYRGEHPLYIHAKVIAADVGTANGRAYLGSHNLSAASLNRNRELGVILTNASDVTAMAALLDRDAAGAARWSG